jgi:hypothetical protein
MTEIQMLEIFSKGGITFLLLLTVYYLHSQYNASIARFYERERDFYNEIMKKLDEIKNEINKKR